MCNLSLDHTIASCFPTFILTVMQFDIKVEFGLTRFVTFSPASVLHQTLCDINTIRSQGLVLCGTSQPATLSVKVKVTHTIWCSIPQLVFTIRSNTAPSPLTSPTHNYTLSIGITLSTNLDNVLDGLNYSYSPGFSLFAAKWIKIAKCQGSAENSTTMIITLTFIINLKGMKIIDQSFTYMHGRTHLVRVYVFLEHKNVMLKQILG